jgi:hypothetical protein
MNILDSPQDLSIDRLLLELGTKIPALEHQFQIMLIDLKLGVFNVTDHIQSIVTPQSFFTNTTDTNLLYFIVPAITTQDVTINYLPFQDKDPFMDLYLSNFSGGLPNARTCFVYLLWDKGGVYIEGRFNKPTRVLSPESNKIVRYSVVMKIKRFSELKNDLKI